MPWIIADPDLPTAGASNRVVTELVDLYSTVAELCGLPIPEHVRV